MQSPSVLGADLLSTRGGVARTHEQIPLPRVDHVSMYTILNAQGHAPRPGKTNVSDPRAPLIPHCVTGTNRNVPLSPVEDENAVALRNLAKRSAPPISGSSTPAKRARIRNRLPSPPSSPLRLRLPPCSTSAPISVRAYKFGAEDNDPDASWSTFSATKLGKRTPAVGSRANKSRNGPSSRIMKSGTFKLPGVGLDRRAKLGKSADAPHPLLQQEQKRRVITYLPPPLQTPKMEGGGASDRETDHRCAERESHELNTSTGGRKDTTIEWRVSLDSEAKNGASVTTTKHEELDDDSANVLLMDSDDATLVGEEHDLHESSSPTTVPFDIGDVCAQYPQLRAEMKEVCVLFPHDMVSPCPRGALINLWCLS
ncbi:hypothetical protein EDC04DRAFT_859423 [Pisolithus marmoratus]|nr:hypothetical protein EDC04DRAFT_859423 [Pisolithus marmoratus]